MILGTKVAVRIVLFIAALAIAFSPVHTASSQGIDGKRLSVTLAPSKLPADGRTHPVVFVQLIGADESPHQAQEPVRVFLSTTDPSIASTPGEVTIPAESSYASVPLTVSNIPGVVGITATAAEYGSGEVELETVSPLGGSPPFRLVISALPPVITQGSSGILAVSLVDEENIPYLAPTDISITLTTASRNIDLPDFITIPRSSHTARTKWKALEPGTAQILAQSNAISADFAEVEVTEVSANPTPVHMVGYPVLSSLPSWETEQAALILLQALDEDMAPVPFPCQSISLTSSNPDVATVSSPLQPPCESETPYVVHSITTTRTPGEVTITAGTSGLTPASIDIETYGLREERIELRNGPAQPLAQDALTGVVTVQLVDEDGRPVIFHDGYKVAILSQGIELEETVTIPAGESFVSIPIDNSPSEETISIVASAPGLRAGRLSFSMDQIPLELSLDVPEFEANLESTITAEASSDGIPLSGVEVVWDVENLLPEPIVTMTDEDGLAQINLRPGQGGDFIDIKVDASKSGYESATVASEAFVGIPFAEPEDGTSRFAFILVFAGAVGALITYLLYNSPLSSKIKRPTWAIFPRRDTKKPNIKANKFW